jgi:hypothetical protein
MNALVRERRATMLSTSPSLGPAVDALVERVPLRVAHIRTAEAMRDALDGECADLTREIEAVRRRTRAARGKYRRASAQIEEQRAVRPLARPGKFFLRVRASTRRMTTDVQSTRTWRRRTLVSAPYSREDQLTESFPDRPKGVVVYEAVRRPPAARTVDQQRIAFEHCLEHHEERLRERLDQGAACFARGRARCHSRLKRSVRRPWRPLSPSRVASASARASRPSTESSKGRACRRRSCSRRVSSSERVRSVRRGGRLPR